MARATATGKAMLEKTVSRHGNSGHVYVPKSWIGKNVAIILEPKEDE